jgi:hypothetical protein
MSVLFGEELRLSTWLVFLWSVTFAIPLSLATLKLGNQATDGLRQFHVRHWNTFADRLPEWLDYPVHKFATRVSPLGSRGAITTAAFKLWHFCRIHTPNAASSRRMTVWLTRAMKIACLVITRVDHQRIAAKLGISQREADSTLENHRKVGWTMQLMFCSRRRERFRAELIERRIARGEERDLFDNYLRAKRAVSTLNKRN